MRDNITLTMCTFLILSHKLNLETAEPIHHYFFFMDNERNCTTKLKRQMAECKQGARKDAQH